MPGAGEPAAFPYGPDVIRGAGALARIHETSIIREGVERPSQEAPLSHSHVPLGVGIYTRAEAARLLRLTPQRLSRWVRGYTYWLKSGDRPRRTRQPPVVRTDLPRIDGAVSLSFLELMELRVVKGFVEKGVPLQRVRSAARRIGGLFHNSHPFADRRVFTDHQHIFVAPSASESEPDLLQVSGRGATLQLIAGSLLDRYVEEMDFDDTTSLAHRWFPLGRDVPIVLDPRIAFGAPVIAGTRIRTDILALYASRNPAPTVARAFELSPAHLRAAIDFETQLAQAA
jgi:uncharacterized protein (DUF433 family)